MFSMHMRLDAESHLAYDGTIHNPIHRMTRHSPNQQAVLTDNALTVYLSRGLCASVIYVNVNLIKTQIFIESVNGNRNIK